MKLSGAPSVVRNLPITAYSRKPYYTCEKFAEDANGLFSTQNMAMPQPGTLQSFHLCNLIEVHIGVVKPLLIADHADIAVSDGLFQPDGSFLQL